MEFKKKLFGYKPEDVRTKLENMDREHILSINKLADEIQVLTEKIDALEGQKKALEQEIENTVNDKVSKILLEKYMDAVGKIHKVNKTVSTSLEGEKHILNGLNEKRASITKALEDYMDNLKNVIDAH